MIRRLLLAAIAAGAALGFAGCRHNKGCNSCGNNSELDRPPQPFLPSGPGVVGPPPSTTIPPAGLPTTPAAPDGAVLPPVTPRGSTPLPPPDFATPPAGSGFRPGPLPPPPGGSKAPSELLLPDPLPGGTSARSSQYPATSDPTRGVLGAPVKPKTATAEPPISKPTAPAAPAGLPGFTPIKDGVATGRKPPLDGFDALKQAGYKTAVYLHGPGADVSPARDVAQARGLTFVAIETTPETLPDALKRVNEIVADRAARPVYVFDDEGTRTGAVWYLHFRTVEQQPADVARVRARGIGLTDQTEEGRAFWVAIQQYLATR